MPDSLVARLADRLDIQPEHTDRVLRTLAQLIKKQSARDGRVRVPGLGVFQQTDEALTFEPDQALAAAVNRRYAGLEAVPLTGKTALAVEEAPFEEEAAAEDAFAGQDEADAEAPLAEKEPLETETALAEEAAVEEALEAETALAEELVEEESLDATLAAEDAYAGPEAAAFEEEETLAGLPPYAPHEALSALPDEQPEAAEETLEAEADLAAPSTWAPPGTRWTGENLDELVEDESAPEEAADVVQEETPAPSVPARAQDLPPAPRPPRMAPPPRPQRRSPLPWILLVLFLGVVAAGAYFFLNPADQPADPGDTPVATGDAPPAAETDPAATGEAGGQSGSSADGQADTSAAAAQPAVPTPAEPAPEAPLRIDRAKGGYTLVVASTTRQQAEAEAERFRQRLSGRSIPVDVLQGVSGGVTRYRVAVGQVATANEAVALKNRLGAALPEGTWVTRIEPDS